jgi:hypothetical protein
MDQSKEQYIAFLLELSELTRKYGIAVNGCGCCSSPYLQSVEVGDIRSGYYMDSDNGDLKWVTPNEETEWREYSQGIVAK